jgi:DNA-binding CsgD family transcriptional regulator
MDYWASVVNEVVNCHKSDLDFCFTDMGENLERVRNRDARRRRRSRQSQPVVLSKSLYRIGGIYNELYLTQREAETCHYLLQGYTIPATGAQLGLSPRTIEFYVKNIKLKLSVKTKHELVEVLKCCPVAELLSKMFISEGIAA